MMLFSIHNVYNAILLQTIALPCKPFQSINQTITGSPMASAMFLNELLPDSAAPFAAADDELVAALVVAVAMPPLELLLPALRALMAITLPPCAFAGALLELVPFAAEM